MGALLAILEHLITTGPARNPAELERLLGLVEQLRPAQPAESPAPPTVPAAPASTTEVQP